MSDEHVLAAILAAPWAKAAALLDVGGVALSCTLACVEDVALCGAEEFLFAPWIERAKQEVPR